MVTHVRILYKKKKLVILLNKYISYAKGLSEGTPAIQSVT